jgi:hypothetical protein
MPDSILLFLGSTWRLHLSSSGQIRLRVLLRLRFHAHYSFNFKVIWSLKPGCHLGKYAHKCAHIYMLAQQLENS